MKTFRRLTGIFSLFLLFNNSLVLTGQTEAGDIFTLPIGTKISVRMDNEINSEVSSVDDTFTATVSDSVIVREVEILPAGTIIEGRITVVKPASFGNKDGNFEVKFESLRLPDGTKRAIDAGLVDLNQQAKSSQIFNAAAILGGTAIGAVFGTFFGKTRGALIGAGLGAGAGTAAVLLKKGKEARIKANEKFEIRLNKKVTLPVQGF